MKLARLMHKVGQTIRVNPGLLPRKVYRKIKRVLLNRFDVGYFYQECVRIEGNFYPVSDLRSSPQSRPVEDFLEVSIVVIIPVYRNIPITKACIDSVLTSTVPERARVLILNDFSPDPQMAGVLDKYRIHPQVEVIHNSENLGFVQNVNLGMSRAGRADVILLNSDTIVSGNWIQRLHGHSLARKKIASVTATSNNATICSFPIMHGSSSWPLGLSTQTVQDVFESHNWGRSIEIPTAVGFCMYITRRSLDALGLFDAAAFGKGYGEENDFCLRGLRHGWKHLQALDVGVFHQGEVSFAGDSHPGKLRASEIILKRYPDYNEIVGDFAQTDPARAMRLGALLALLAKANKPVELVCTHIHGGGVEKAVSSFLDAASDKVHFLVLKRAHDKGFYQINSLIDGVKFEFEFSATYSATVFAAILTVARIRMLHIHHVMDFDKPMLELLRDCGLPFRFYIHDYWTICPQITLTTVEGTYCGEPIPAVCNACIASRGERTHAPLAGGLATNIVDWRRQYNWIFDRAEKIISPSFDVAERMATYHKSKPVDVSYHEPQAPLQSTSIQLRPITQSMPLKVAILGAIGVHKGFFKISRLQGLIQESKAPIELTIFGDIDPLIAMKNPVKATGRYLDAELQSLLTDAGIHVIWFPEGAPETYSFTLSHAMRHGYPVVAPMIGAFPERLKGRPWTELTNRDESEQGVLELLFRLRQAMMMGNREQSDGVR